MTRPNKLVFFGTEHFSVPSLQKLIASDWQITAVVTKPDQPSGRGRRLHSPAVKVVAENFNIPTLQPSKAIDILADLSAIGAGAAVLAAYGNILPRQLLDLFPSGIINVHPSLLPKYRGPSPIETTILNGDKQTGVSLMRLVEKMDAGPVFCQQTYALTGDETRQRLTDELAQLGADLLSRQLEPILNGQLEAAAQDETRATYTKLLTKADGTVNWQEPAELIERKIRAYQGFPKASTVLFNKYPVIITRSRVVKSNLDGLIMKCQPGWLEITELIGPSGRRMSGAEFLRGYKP